MVNLPYEKIRLLSPPLRGIFSLQIIRFLVVLCAIKEGFHVLVQFTIDIKDLRLMGLRLEDPEKVGDCPPGIIEAIQIELSQFCHHFKPCSWFPPYDVSEAIRVQGKGRSALCACSSYAIDMGLRQSSHTKNAAWFFQRLSHDVEFVWTVYLQGNCPTKKHIQFLSLVPMSVNLFASLETPFLAQLDNGFELVIG
jgi:hypothetical protein